MRGTTNEDRIKNEYVKGSIGMASIVDKMKENRLRLSGHIMRGNKLESVRTLMEMKVGGRRPKKK